MADPFYQNLPRLVTEQLRLRPFTLGDVDDYFLFASDPEVTQYLRWGPHPDREYTRDYLQGVLEAYAAGSDSPWGIELKAERRIVGIMHLMALDRLHRKAHIGFVLARPYWKQGYVTEAVQAVLKYGFTKMELNRIEAYCLPENMDALRVLERLGMQREGLLRQYAWQKDAFRDFYLYALLKLDCI
jgi:ribosomal-protein-alanine N-acetyltransferase